ncbi:benzoate/H(+) symporter BenE family transporter [Phycobacter azelaicus]|uniref:benzoate/H(+) symporter BenE family transporter n=1 Tax=Phycobacter azelaicus TaxID=2668075 RepID=UPI001866BFC2|nr:benzoate/H(+) symporter BenE family transporter [Phycobacter azelaicus]MBE1297916.1 benzoate/H(+) symporter BenE family transporter [Paracoccaceae bacterium]
MPQLKLSHITAGAVAVLVGYTSSVAIIFQAIDALGATQAQANSWLLALGIGMGVTSLILSFRFRMPVLTAWSTPGAALLALGGGATTLPEATGAFLFCAVLLTLTGLTGWFERLACLIPDTLANALLAGILFRFGLEAFSSMEEDIWLVAVMGAAFLMAKLYAPRYAIPLVLLAGILWASAAGSFGDIAQLNLTLATPEAVKPEFTLSAFIGLGLPLYIVTMCSQNMPGVVTLRSAGYVPPVSAAMTVTGLASLILAPFGGYTFNLAAITAAICAGPEADEDPKTRYLAVVAAGVIYCLVGLGGAAVISLFLIAPHALVATVAGLALLSTIGNGLSHALEPTAGREAALLCFMGTVSGISFLGIGAPFWALLIGLVAHITLSRPAPALFRKTT